MRIAETAAPRVNEPSTVMSGKRKMRNDIKTPNASRVRISPFVQAPMRRVMSAPVLQDLVNGAKPAGAADEFALTQADRFAPVRQQVQDSLDVLLLEQCGHGGTHLQLAAGQ